MEQADAALIDIIRAEHGDSADDDDDDPDYGLYYPLDYVLMTWQERRSHGTLPEQGGLNDQDWRLVYHDWPVLNARFNYLTEQLYPSDPDKPPVNPAIPLPDNPKSLKDIL